MHQYQRPQLRSSPKPGLKVTARFLVLCVLALGVTLLSVVYFSTSFLAFQSMKEPALFVPLQAAVQEVPATPSLLFFRTDFCHPCDEMEAHLQSTPAIQALKEEAFAFLRVDAFAQGGSDAALCEQYDILTLPTLLAIDANGQITHRFTGTFPVAELQQAFSSMSIIEVKASISPAPSSTPYPAHVYLKGNGISSSAPMYGLFVHSEQDYFSARKAAMEYSYQWNKGVWIHRGGSRRYEVVLGAFDGEEKARITARLLQAWDKLDSEVVSLDADWEIY